MRFLADENVSRLVVERLRAGGFDVNSIAETRSGTPDKDVLDAADAEGCILSPIHDAKLVGATRSIRKR
jgi:uncharacterized protein DUF5615